MLTIPGGARSLVRVQPLPSAIISHQPKHHRLFAITHTITERIIIHSNTSLASINHHEVSTSHQLTINIEHQPSWINSHQSTVKSRNQVLINNFFIVWWLIMIIMVIHGLFTILNHYEPRLNHGDSPPSYLTLGGHSPQERLGDLVSESCRVLRVSLLRLDPTWVSRLRQRKPWRSRASNSRGTGCDADGWWWVVSMTTMSWWSTWRMMTMMVIRWFMISNKCG